MMPEKNYHVIERISDKRRGNTFVGNGKAILDGLVTGLESVTPGPYATLGDEWVIGPDGQTLCQGYDFEMTPADTRHFARCDPDSIRAISTYVAALEARLEIWVKSGSPKE
jgi:hypothetical protein